LRSSNANWRWRFVLLSACAALAAAIEWTAQGTPRDAWAAIWVVWCVALLLPAALALAAAPLWPRLPGWLSWWAALFPAAAIVFHQIAHESTWPHLALGMGGVQHWSRVALLVGAGLVLPAYALSRCDWALRSRRGDKVAALLSSLLLSIGALQQFWPASRVERAQPAPSTPHVLLISIDTLRQDALACYGGRSTALDPWIERAQVIDGFAPSPWTLPSLRALMRGVAHSGAGGALARRAPEESLARSLQSAGYRTAAFVSNAHLMSDFGFQKGFDRYDHADQIEPLLPARGAKLARWWTRQWTERRQLELGDRRADAALRWLEAQDDAAPWFLWLHLIDPHLPYHLRGGQGARQPHATPDWLATLGAAFSDGKFFDLPGMRAGTWPQSGPFLTALRELYASEVDFAAWHASRVLERAQAVRGRREVLWILTSDHGEEFFEHGGFEHGHALGQELLRIPLVVGGAEATLPSTMRLQDLAPWLLRRLELPALSAPANLPAQLTPFVLGGEPARCAPPLLAGGLLYGDPQWRWIRPDGESTLWRADGSTWRNNVCSDRLDLRLSATPADSTERSLHDAARLWWQQESLGQPDGELEHDLRERLKALGYLGG
jgi:hypothetical protein